MTARPHTKRQRQSTITTLLEEGPIPSQRELAERLAERGIEVNQATLSRDVRELGVVKGPEGYRLAGEPAAHDDDPAALGRAAREWLTSAAVAANQVVLRTPPSGAQPLALAIDRSRIEGVLGTVAGDDTVLVVTAGASQARAFADRLNELARGSRT